MPIETKHTPGPGQLAVDYLDDTCNLLVRFLRYMASDRPHTAPIRPTYKFHREIRASYCIPIMRRICQDYRAFFCHRLCCFSRSSPEQEGFSEEVKRPYYCRDGYEDVGHAARYNDNSF